MLPHTQQQTQDLLHKIQDMEISSSTTNNMTMIPTETTTSCTTRLVSVPYDEIQMACPAAAPTSPFPSDISTDTPDASSVSGQQYANIEEKYIVDPHVLGSGHHGSVRQCIDRQTGQRFAVKSIRKSDPSVKPGCLQREIMLLDEMRHPNIIQLVDVFEDDSYLHIVTDLCTGGELFDKIVEKASNTNSEGCFSEYEAARILHQLLSAVQDLHRRNIVHRDLKPENILFQTNDEDSPIKIIDFGLARKHYASKGEPPMRTVVGTPYYIAPDVLRKNYSKACDLWSIGVIAYVLLCGYPPFNGANNADVYAAVRRGVYWFPSDDWKNISVGAKDFVHRLLQKDPRNRMTVEKALRHPWLVGQMMSAEKENTSVEVVFEESSRKESVLCDGVVNQQILL